MGFSAPSRSILAPAPIDEPKWRGFPDSTWAYPEHSRRQDQELRQSGIARREE
eukprot:gene21392-15869_t